MKRKKYKPKKGAINYDASIAVSHENSCEYIAKCVITILLIATLIIPHGYNNNKYFSFALLIVYCVAILLIIYDAVKLHIRQNTLLSGGGHIHSENSKKHMRSTTHNILGSIVLAALFVVLGVLQVKPNLFHFTNPRNNTLLTIIMIVFMLFITYLIYFFSLPWFYASDVIFMDNYFATGLFDVSYDGLSVRVKDNYLDPKAVRIWVTFHKDNKQVGHDIFYRDDYEHLRELLEQRSKIDDLGA